MKKLFLVQLILIIMFNGVLGSTEGRDSKKKKKEKPGVLKHHIVVTATRTDQPKIEVGSSTTLITAEELKKAGKTTVVEALTTVPGLDVAQNGLSHSPIDT